MKRIAIALTIIVAAFSSVALHAHDRYRIVGTVTKITADDSILDLVVLEIRLVPAIPAPKKPQ